jgi:hypothetical protein
MQGGLYAWRSGLLRPGLQIIEFIPINPLLAMASDVSESYAAHSRLP